MTKSNRDAEVAKIVALGEGVVTDLGPYTNCKNCSKPFNSNSTAEEIAFGYHKEHRSPEGFWKGPHNQDAVDVSVTREKLRNKFGAK